MRRFTCGTCASAVPFDADRCPSCGAELGYLPALRDIRVLHRGDAPGAYTVVGDPTVSWRCLNHAWGCNWMLARHTGDVWCASCRLTRGRPDTANPDAVEAWAAAERAKRRLVDQLIALGLPLGGWGGGHPLVFDLLFLPDGAGATGHRQGVITLDLREVDDAYRETVRRQLGEQYRTVLGHLRHEAGHYYWPLLVEDPGDVGAFRALFGDERADYASSLDGHYGTVPGAAVEGYVSAYAAAHPSEDWAETVAHYLHMSDGLETARSYALAPAAEPEESVAAKVATWRVVSTAVDEINLGLGHPPAYPFEIAGRVAEKLAFVHRQVGRVTRRPPRTGSTGL